MKKISNRYESNFRYMYFEFWVSVICVIKYLSKTWHTHDFRNQVLCLLYASLSKEAQFTKLPLSFHSWSFFKIKSLASCWKETTIYREGADFNKSKYWKHWHHHMHVNQSAMESLLLTLTASLSLLNFLCFFKRRQVYS